MSIKGTLRTSSGMYPKLPYEAAQMLRLPINVNSPDKEGGHPFQVELNKLCYEGHGSFELWHSSASWAICSFLHEEQIEMSPEP